MSTFTSPVPTSLDIAGLPAPPAGGSPATIVQGLMPDVMTAIIPATGLYDGGANPLIISPIAPGILIFIANNEAVSVLVMGPNVGDPGVVIPAGATTLLGFDAVNDFLFNVGGTAGGVVTFAAVQAALAAATGSISFNGQQINNFALPPGFAATGGFMIWYNLRSDAAVRPGPSVPVFAWFAEVNAPYKFVPGSVMTPNGWTVIAPTGGTAGNWELVGNEIYLPINGGDDRPNWSACIAACNVTGVGLMRLFAGTYLIATVPASTAVTIISNVNIQGAGIGKTIVRSTIAAGPALNAPLFGTALFGTLGTVAVGNVVVNGRTFRSATVLTQGSYVQLQNANHVAVYQITNVNLTAPPTYTVDRPILRPFLLGDGVLPVTTILKNATLSDFSLRGSGTRGFDVICTWNVWLKNVKIELDLVANAMFTEGASFDTGCYLSGYDTVEVQGDGLSTYGTFFESSEKMTRRLVVANGCTSKGEVTWDCYDSQNELCEAGACGSGQEVGGDSALTAGSVNVRTIGGSYNGNVGAGVEAGRGDRNSWFGVQAQGNTANNWDISAGLAVSAVTLTACQGKSSTTGANFQVRALATGTKLIQCVSESAAAVGYRIIGECQGDDLASINDTYALFVDPTTAGNVALSHVRVTNAGTEAMRVNATTARVTLRDAVLGLANGAIAVNHTSATVLELDSVATVGGAGGSVGYQGIAGSTLRMVGRVDLDSTATKFTINATGFVSRSLAAPAKRLILNGATPVAIAFPDLKTGETPKLFLLTKAGAAGTGLAPLIAVTPATGFTGTSVINDNDEWHWEI